MKPSFLWNLIKLFLTCSCVHVLIWTNMNISHFGCLFRPDPIPAHYLASVEFLCLWNGWTSSLLTAACQHVQSAVVYPTVSKYSPVYALACFNMSLACFLRILILLYLSSIISKERSKQIALVYLLFLTIWVDFAIPRIHFPNIATL